MNRTLSRSDLPPEPATVEGYPLSLKKKQKKLDWWVENYGEKEGKKRFDRYLEYRRKRTLEVLKTLSGIGFLLKLIGR